MLSGYSSDREYDKREPDYTPDLTLIDIEMAVAASRSWLMSHPAGTVEVIQEVNGNFLVVRVVTSTGVDIITN